MWHSQKLNDVGLRYEVGVSLWEYILWINGLHKRGDKYDVKIFRESLKSRLCGSEKVVTDRGYPDVRSIIPYSTDTDRRFQGRIRARREYLNQRLKQFSIRRTFFRRSVRIHATIFYAVANVIQICWNTEPLLQFII